MTIYYVWAVDGASPSNSMIEADTSFAARVILSNQLNLPVFKIAARPADMPASNPGYSPDAVDKAIASSNRAGRKISKKEAAKIHAVLKGRE